MRNRRNRDKTQRQTRPIDNIYWVGSLVQVPPMFFCRLRLSPREIHNTSGQSPPNRQFLKTEQPHSYHIQADYEYLNEKMGAPDGHIVLN